MAVGFFLDGASACGWALMRYEPVENPTLIARGTFQPPTGSHRSWGWRWHLLDKWLQEMVDEHKPDRAAFEAPYIGNVGKAASSNPQAMQSTEAAIRFLVGVDAVIEMVMARNHIPCTEVVPSSAKKAMTGSGRPGKNREENKRLMKSHAIARGYLVADDNQADAIGVGLHVIGNHFRGRR